MKRWFRPPPKIELRFPFFILILIITDISNGGCAMFDRSHKNSDTPPSLSKTLIASVSCSFHNQREIFDGSGIVFCLNSNALKCDGSIDLRHHFALQPDFHSTKSVKERKDV